MILIAQYIVHDIDYIDYLLYCIGGTFAGIGVSCISVILNIKWNVIERINDN